MYSCFNKLAIKYNLVIILGECCIQKNDCKSKPIIRSFRTKCVQSLLFAPYFNCPPSLQTRVSQSYHWHHVALQRDTQTFTQTHLGCLAYLFLVYIKKGKVKEKFTKLEPKNNLINDHPDHQNCSHQINIKSTDLSIFPLWEDNVQWLSECVAAMRKLLLRKENSPKKCKLGLEHPNWTSEMWRMVWLYGLYGQIIWMLLLLSKTQYGSCLQEAWKTSL